MNVGSWISSTCPSSASWDYHHESSNYQDSIHSGDSLYDKDDHRDTEFSEDEGLASDRIPVTRLFRPSLFKALLYKAKVSTNMDAPASQSDPSDTPKPPDGLFTIPKAEKDFIPCPQLFSELIQRPWGNPLASTTPNNLDKKLLLFGSHPARRCNCQRWTPQLLS